MLAAGTGTTIGDESDTQFTLTLDLAVIMVEYVHAKLAWAVITGVGSGS